MVSIARSFSCVVLACMFAQGQKVPQPIPAGFDFPAVEQSLLQLRDNSDVTGMRRHAWMVFAGMTQPVPSGEAVWETWYSSNETFGAAQPQALNLRKLQRRFQAPRQFSGVGVHPQAVGASLASFTLFNEDLRTFVRQNKLYQKSTLAAINKSFGPQTPVEKREIPAFPNKAVAVKTVWWIVKKSGMTAIPVWDAALNPPLPNGNPFPSWKRCVAIDPARPSIPTGETRMMSCNQGSQTATSVVALDSFYHFTITQDDLNSLHQLPNDIPNLNTAAVGDYLALIAMHVTTKEIADWVWATFWWHDKPSEGAFAAARPDQVHGAWRNYLMSTAYSMDTPREADNSAHAAFNPWLEARFVNGAVSNCMTCHRRSVFSGKSSDPAFLPVTRGTPAASDPRFAGATKLDFLWSVLLESQ